MGRRKRRRTQQNRDWHQPLSPTDKQLVRAEKRRLKAERKALARARKAETQSLEPRDERAYLFISLDLAVFDDEIINQKQNPDLLI